MCPEATSSAQRGRENSVQLEVKGARLWARSRWWSGLREEAAPGLPVHRAHSVPSQNHQRDSPAHLCPQPWWHSWAVVGSNGKDLAPWLGALGCLPMVSKPHKPSLGVLT